MALLVEFFIHRDRSGAGGIAGDNGFGAELFGNDDPDAIGVVGAIGDNVVGGVEALEQGLRKQAVMDLPGADLDAQRVKPLYQRSLAIDEKALNPEHPLLATDLNNLAALYQAQGSYAEAEPLYQRALEIDEKALGPEHPDVATSLENYASLLRETGRADEAAEMETRAQAIRAKYE